LISARPPSLLAQASQEIHTLYMIAAQTAARERFETGRASAAASRMELIRSSPTAFTAPATKAGCSSPTRTVFVKGSSTPLDVGRFPCSLFLPHRILIHICAVSWMNFTKASVRIHLRGPHPAQEVSRMMQPSAPRRLVRRRGPRFRRPECGTLVEGPYRANGSM